MIKTINEIFKSGSGGVISTGLYILIAHYLDKLIDAKTSNAIALIASGIFNYIIQSVVFASDKIGTNIDKFMVLQFIILIPNQVVVNYFINNKDKYIEKLPKLLRRYYNMIIRIIIASIIFIVISYPIRKYWVFR